MTRAAARARRLAARLRTSFPGEISGDAFAGRIRSAAADPRVRTILEIGSATGDGSTRELVAGAERNPSRPRLFCLEVERGRFDELRDRYASHELVHSYRASSVAPEAYASEEAVCDFYRAVPTALNAYPLEQVLGWRREELEYLATAGIPVDGIERVRGEHGVETFDCVLLDGSEFTAGAELDLVLGARLILLDDVNSFKNHANCLRLLGDSAYRLADAGPRLRHGYVVFELTESASR